MHSFPRPASRYLSVAREPASGACPECGAAELADYRVFGDGGWWDVRKCQRCLASIAREPAPRFGSYVPLGLEVAGPGAGEEA
jgi:vanillate/4-hydroxybenzoate decarboxylase subunit D